MKKLFKSAMLLGALAFALAPLTGCSDDGGTENETGLGNIVTDINNPKEGKTVNRYGETVPVKFNSKEAWTADLEFVDGENWASISYTSGDEGGAGSVNVSFLKNDTDTERQVKLMIHTKSIAAGELCTFTQAKGSNAPSSLSLDLNKKMHDVLVQDYLWNKEYAALGDKIDMNTDWEEFLETNLVKLGDVNIEDGGYYRDFSSLRGQRFIYSYIQDITGSRAVQYNNLGIGPTNSANYDQAGTVALIIGYIYQGSPAEKAGLLRGDMITEVNGTRVTINNYYQIQSDLFYNQTGTYTLKFSRTTKLEGETYPLPVPQPAVTVTSAAYTYTPVITTGVIDYEAKSDGKKHKIGLLVTEAFDLSNQQHFVETLKSLQEQGITDLVLDLRYNVGGAVAQARYLASAIAGPSHKEDIFLDLVKNDGKHEKWTFGYGDINNQDGLGEGPDLGLKRLYVICSETTASAAELIINGLRGIDFPVYLYGSRTAGKNVGMEVRELTSGTRSFEFAPITFRCFNAKGEGDYKDGFLVDKMVNNQNSNLDDDLSPLFPYATRDWAYADEAMLWAVLNIAGDDDSALENWSPSSAAAASRAMRFEPLENIVYKVPFGRGGNLIY